MRSILANNWVAVYAVDGRFVAWVLYSRAVWFNVLATTNRACHGTRARQSVAVRILPAGKPTRVWESVIESVHWISELTSGRAKLYGARIVEGLACFVVGEVVKPSGRGRTATWEGMVGTVTRVSDESVFVQWHECAFEDELDFKEVVSTGASNEMAPHHGRVLDGSDDPTLVTFYDDDEKESC